jgi:hypothetical protein
MKDMTFTVQETATGIAASDPKAVAVSFADLVKATQESFWALALNAKNVEIGRKCLFVGGLNSSIVDLRIVYRYLIESGATCWVAVHNHPSGDVEPSPEDRRINRKLKDAGEMLGLELLDVAFDSGRSRTGRNSVADKQYACRRSGGGRRSSGGQCTGERPGSLIEPMQTKERSRHEREGLAQRQSHPLRERSQGIQPAGGFYLDGECDWQCSVELLHSPEVGDRV